MDIFFQKQKERRIFTHNNVNCWTVTYFVSLCPEQVSWLEGFSLNRTNFSVSLSSVFAYIPTGFSSSLPPFWFVQLDPPNVIFFATGHPREKHHWSHSQEIVIYLRVNWWNTSVALRSGMVSSGARMLGFVFKADRKLLNADDSFWNICSLTYKNELMETHISAKGDVSTSP